MGSGFRVDTDPWIKDHDESKALAMEILQLIQERNADNRSGPEASRKTASARRKLGTLGSQIDKLSAYLDAPEGGKLSEQEKNRRRDQVYDLKSRRESMLHALKRNNQQQDRDNLLAGSSSQVQPRETEQTADLDNKQLLQLQNKIIKVQDEELETMEKSIISTKHIALAINEEVNLQTRLLDDLDEEVDVTHSRLRAASKRIGHILKHKSNWKWGFFIFILIITLTIVAILGMKISKLFGH